MLIIFTVQVKQNSMPEVLRSEWNQKESDECLALESKV